MKLRELKEGCVYSLTAFEINTTFEVLVASKAPVVMFYDNVGEHLKVDGRGYRVVQLIGWLTLEEVERRPDDWEMAASEAVTEPSILIGITIDPEPKVVQLGYAPEFKEIESSNG